MKLNGGMFDNDTNKGVNLGEVAKAKWCNAFFAYQMWL